MMHWSYEHSGSLSGYILVQLKPEALLALFVNIISNDENLLQTNMG